MLQSSAHLVGIHFQGSPNSRRSNLTPHLALRPAYSRQLTAHRQHRCPFRPPHPQFSFQLSSRRGSGGGVKVSTVTSGLFLSSLKLNSKGVIVLVIPTSRLPREGSLSPPPPSSFFWGAARQFIKAPLLNPQSELPGILCVFFPESSHWNGLNTI